MTFSKRTKRIFLCTLVSVLAYLGPEIHSNPGFAPPPEIIWNGYPKYSVDVPPMDPVIAYKRKVLLSPSAEVWEDTFPRTRQTEEEIKEWEKMGTEVTREGAVTHGSAIRNSLLCAFAQTFTQLTGTFAGLFYDTAYEHWASKAIAAAVPVGIVYERTTAVKTASYLGRWAGWWVFLALLSLPIRWWKFIHASDLKNDSALAKE